MRHSLPELVVSSVNLCHVNELLSLMIIFRLRSFSSHNLFHILFHIHICTHHTLFHHTAGYWPRPVLFRPPLHLLYRCRSLHPPCFRFHYCARLRPEQANPRRYRSFLVQNIHKVRCSVMRARSRRLPWLLLQLRQWWQLGWWLGRLLRRLLIGTFEFIFDCFTNLSRSFDLDSLKDLVTKIIPFAHQTFELRQFDFIWLLVWISYNQI